MGKKKSKPNGASRGSDRNNPDLRTATPEALTKGSMARVLFTLEDATMEVLCLN